MSEEHWQKVVVFTNDYIVPTNWIRTVLTEFGRYLKAGYLTPATVFVAQEQRLVPLTLKPHIGCSEATKRKNHRY